MSHADQEHKKQRRQLSSAVRRVRSALTGFQHAVMFKPKSSDLPKSLKKLSNAKKDLRTRYKHLKLILDHNNPKESKSILSEETEEVFAVFVECFQTLDSTLKQKGSKINKEDVDSVLYSLERILLLLPEFIRTCPPQLSIITTVLKRCLHPNSALRLRRETMRPFLTYYQILRDLCPSEMHQLFNALVPGMPSCTSPGDLKDSEKVDIFENAPPLLLPSLGEKPPESVTRMMYETLLDLLVSQVFRICWDNPDQFQISFAFLFEKFKCGYLARIFPESRVCIMPVKGYYRAQIEGTAVQNPFIDAGLVPLQVATLRWVITFLQSPESLRPEAVPDAHKKRLRDSSVSDMPDSGLAPSRNRESSGSFSAAFQNFLHFEVSVPNTAVDGKQRPAYASNIYLMVRHTLLSTPSNVQLIHEMFELAFRLPATEYSVIRRVVAVYESWITGNEGSRSVSVNGFHSDMIDSGAKMNQGIGYPVFTPDSSTLKLFCVNSVHQFSAETSRNDLSPAEKSKVLDEQADICKKIILLYRKAIQRIPMSLSTWECILQTLIRVTNTLLPAEPPKDRMGSLAGRLSDMLFSTLVVAWVKGTLSASISSQFWNDLSEVLCNLTKWPELIERWKKTLVLITKFLASEVFKVETDFDRDLPASMVHTHSDDGTLVADQPRCQSNASSSTTEGITVQMFGRSEQDSGSVRSEILEIDELEESPKERAKDGTLKNASPEEATSKKKHHTSGEENDSTLSNSEHLMDTSRSTSTPDSLRDSLSSPLFYSVGEGEKKRAASSCSGMSIMAGGLVQGWSPESACALWFRVCGVIGEMNKIQNPDSHRSVLESLGQVVEMLHMVQDKKEIFTDSIKIKLSVIDKFVPAAIIAPVLFETLTLSEKYHGSRVVALTMLCQITFRAKPIPKTFCVHLIRVLHSTLLSANHNLIETVVKHAGVRLFTSEIPNAFLLVEDFISAAHFLAKDGRDADLQLNIIHILTSIYFYLQRLPKSFTVLSPIPDTNKLKPCHNHEVQSKIHHALLMYTNVTFPWIVRKPAFHCVGAILYSLLEQEADNPFMMENLIKVIVNAVENYAGEGVSDVIGIVVMMCNHAQRISKILPRTVFHVVETLCIVIGKMSAEIPMYPEIPKEIEEVFVKLVLCLCEWIVAVPEVASMTADEGTGTHTIRYLIEKTLEGILYMSDVVHIDQDDASSSGTSEPKVRSKRGFSEYLQDRRFSADVGTAIAKSAEEESHLTRRATAIFGGRTAGEARERKAAAVRPDIRTQPIFLESRLRVLKLVACYAARHMANMFQSVPDAESWALTTSLVSEDDNLPGGTNVSDNLQVFSIYDMIVSMRTIIPTEAVLEKKGDNLTDAFSNYPRVRIVMRDIAGKYCYDVRFLFGKVDIVSSLYQTNFLESGHIASLKTNLAEDRDAVFEKSRAEESSDKFEKLVTNHSPDLLLDIMKYIDKTSPEIGLSQDHPWNHPGPPPPGLTAEEEAEAVRIMQEQHHAMTEYVENKRNLKQLHAPPALPEPYSLPKAAFGYCSRLLSQFGYAGMGKRQHFHLMNRTEEMCRDLKLLDRRPNRDFQKIAVIYVARGQEDKLSVMTNSVGSEAYERFVNRLGWTIDVNEHKGFRGGLPQNSWQFGSAVYYASATLEVVFHVATRVGALSPEDHTVKMRHIGNDEVQIIWSDHYRDYDRKILPTQFGDVIICIYPAEPRGLFRIQIMQKDNVPSFGPLYDGAIVDEENLAGLIRNTALNAGKACRKTIKGFQYFFEERAEYLKSLIQNYTIEGTYEHFLSSIISPQPVKMPIPLAAPKDMLSVLQPSWRESTRRYNDRLRSRAEKDKEVPVINLRYSLPPRSGSTSSTTEV